MSEGSSSSSSGIGFIGLLTVMLIGLKLTGYLKIGWLWVFAPAVIWISIKIILIILVFLTVIIFRKNL